VSWAEVTPEGSGVAAGATVGVGVGPVVAAGAVVGVAWLVVTWVGTGVAGAAPAQATANTAIIAATGIGHRFRFRRPISTSLLKIARLFEQLGYTLQYVLLIQSDSGKPLS
jgi:hypothetical protein